MSDLTWARVLMGTTLGLHIIYAVVGIGLPLIVAVVHAVGLRRNDARYLQLARSLTRLVILLFALGAATGIVIAFELSLFWPRFMAIAGPVVGAAFTTELIAFFLEAIFLAIYVYGRDRIRNPWAHWACLLPVVVGAVASGVLITLINGWMNVPAGFSIRDGMAVDVDPAKALLRTNTVIEVLHLATTSYLVTAGLVATVAGLGVLLRRGRPGQAQLALGVSLVVAAAVAIPVIVSGDMSAKQIGYDQPEKLAVAEALFHTQSHAPETIGGIVDTDQQTTHFGIEIPGLLSFLSRDSTDATVPGLDAFARDTWPPLYLHYTFDFMVGVGFLATLIAFWGVWYLWRKRRLPERGLLLLGCIALGPLTVAAMECGWMLTEVGRQPWIIYGVMLTKNAVTTAPGVGWIAGAFLFLWGVIAVGTLWLIVKLLRIEETDVSDTAPAGATA